MSKKKTKKKITNVVVIDASGSMSTKAFEVIGGLKKLFQDIKTDAETNTDVEYTTVLVDFASHNDIRVLLNTNDCKLLVDSVADAYSTRGMTALYDAILVAFKEVKEKQDGVFVTIITDGQENDSKEMNNASIKELIEQKKKANWVITFMGTTDVSVNNAVEIGVSRGNTRKFADTSAGFDESMRLMRSVRSDYSKSITLDSFPVMDLENMLKKEEV